MWRRAAGDVYPTDDRWAALASGGSYTPAASFQAVRGARTLASRLDVSTFRESASSDGRKVTHTLDLTCPDPTGSLADGPDAPLGWMGQQLIARAGFASGDLQQTVPLGQWRIDRPDPGAPTWVPYPTGMQVRRGSSVRVTSSSLLGLLTDDLPVLTGPLPGGTIQSEVIRLVDGRLPVASTWWDPVLAAQPAPASQVYQDNRLGAICDLLATIGGVAWVDRAGAFRPIPADKSGVDWVIPPGAIVTPRQVGSRDGVHNVVIVTGTDDDGNELRAVAREEHGPFSVHGSFGVVTRTYSNPLGKTQAALDQTASTYLWQAIRGRSIRYEVELTTPNWALDVLDRVQFTTPDGRTVTGPVVHLERDPSGMSIEVPVPWAEVWPDAVAL